MSLFLTEPPQRGELAVPSNTMSVPTTDRGRSAKAAAAKYSVISNTSLVIMKLVVGLMIGSVAVVSEAIHSAIDLVAAIIAFYSVRASDIPPDEDHPYGHGKIESVSGTVEAALIFVAGIWIIWEAVHAIISGKALGSPGWGVLVMAISALVNIFVARHLFKVAEREDSVALKADAHHLSIDVYTSIGVFVGLGLVQVTGQHILDPIVAMLVGCLILYTAYNITREAFYPLLDAALPPDEQEAIAKVLDQDKRVLGWHRLRTRKSGSQRHIDLHLQLEDGLSLKDAHDITHDVKDAIREAVPNALVFIHTEPFREEMRRHPVATETNDPD